jgi:hypothetical protein
VSEFRPIVNQSGSGPKKFPQEFDGGQQGLKPRTAAQNRFIDPAKPFQSRNPTVFLWQ